MVVFSEQGLGGRVLEVEDCGRLIDRKAVLKNHLYNQKTANQTYFSAKSINPSTIACICL